MTRSRGPTAIAIALLVAALVMVVLIVTGLGSDSYTVTARFTDASQLVKGNVVQVGGRTVGTVKALELADNGQADVVMKLTDDSVHPLHVGTRATVRSLGLSGVANRFIDLSPGLASSAEIPDGGTIGVDRTRGVVDLDVLLDSLDPKVRGDIQGIVRDAATALTPEAAKQTNAGIHLFNPAVAQLAALGRELTRDQAALGSLVTHTASLSRVLARHRAALGSGIEATAGVLGAVASEREQLAAALAAAPDSLRTTTATLRRLRTQTLPAVDPVLEGAEPTIKPFGDLLRVTTPTLRNATPLVARLRGLVPEARKALQPLPRLQRQASPALASASKALKEALPLITGLRPYTPELVSGFFSGFGGNSAHAYDANGHYQRVSLNLGIGTLPGLIPIPAGAELGGYRTGMDARCPGGAEEPAPDRSNPTTPAGNSCDPKDNHR
jgi:phospholipid/cholesterol/gamma-HCH transport system substrate-binding protein